MHIHPLEQWTHTHKFNIDHTHGERKTKQVILLTAITMVVEIVAGSIYGSMALLADGWHMGTHVAALSITVFAYSYARRHANDTRYSFGTGKVGVLGGFASGVVLVVVALLMGIESLHRLVSPQPIQFNEAIVVAVLGFGVNLLSMFLLQGQHHHGHAHEHHHHKDHNLRAAYLHVLTDALTSVLAIIALLAGKAFGWVWLDPIMGIVGAVLITRWSYGLLRDTSGILLDSQVDSATLSKVRSAIEADADNQVADLHIWRIAPQHSAAIISIVTHHPQSPEHYKKLLADFGELTHVTIEACPCTDKHCIIDSQANLARWTN
ncbi:MAG TPA: cation transporter [Thioploca sp.]|nr:cation transporter [Thioploca sp.]